MQQFIRRESFFYAQNIVPSEVFELRKDSHLILLGRKFIIYSYPMSYSNRFIFPFAGNEPSSTVDNSQCRRRRWKWLHIIDVTSWHMSIYRTSLLTHSHKMPCFALHSHCFISDNPLHAADINERWRCRLVWSLILSEVKKRKKWRKNNEKGDRREEKYDFLKRYKVIKSTYSIFFLWNCFIIA